MTDEPLVRPRLLSQLLMRRPLSLVPRGYSLVSSVQRRHRSLGSHRARMALVQRIPLVSRAQVSRREAGWRPVRMVWFGRPTPFEPAVDQISPQTPAVAPGPRTAPVVARQPAAGPSPLPSRPPEARAQRPRVAAQPAAQPAPRPAPTPDQQPAPPAAPAPESSSGLVRGSDLWQRLFPERPSLMQTLRDTGVSRQAETARRMPPPVIPSRLPRTRTWEVKPGQPVSPVPPGASREETVSLDAEDGAETPEAESDADTAARAGPEPDSGEAATVPHVQREPPEDRPARRSRVSRRPRPPAVAETPARAETVGVQRDRATPVVESHPERPAEPELAEPEFDETPSPAQAPPVSRRAEDTDLVAVEPQPAEPSPAPAAVQAKAAEPEIGKPGQAEAATPADVEARPERKPVVRPAAVPPKVQTVKAEPAAEKPRRAEAAKPAAVEPPAVTVPIEVEPAEPVSAVQPGIQREMAEPSDTPAEQPWAAPEVPAVQPAVEPPDIQAEAVQPSREEAKTRRRPARTAEVVARAPEEPPSAPPLERPPAVQRATPRPEEPPAVQRAAPQPGEPPAVQRVAPGPVGLPAVRPTMALPDTQTQDVPERTRPAAIEGAEAEPVKEPAERPAARPSEVQLTAEPETVVSREPEPEAKAKPEPAVKPQPRRDREVKPSAKPSVSRKVEAEPVAETPPLPAELPVEAVGAEAPGLPPVSRRAEEPVAAEPVGARQPEAEPVRAEKPAARPSLPRVALAESPPGAAKAEGEIVSPRVRAEPKPEEPPRAGPRGIAPRVQAAPEPETAAAVEGEVRPMRIHAERAPAVSRHVEQPEEGSAEPAVAQLWHPFSGFSPLPMRQEVGRPAVDRQAEKSVARPSLEMDRGARPAAQAVPGPARLPLHVPVTPIAAVQRVEGEASGTSSETSTRAEPREAGAEGQPQVDKDRLAREVYEILKQRMIVEREQFWGF